MQYGGHFSNLTRPIPIPDEEKKLKLNSYFSHPLCDHSKGFIKALKAFINKTFWVTTKKCENKNLA